MSKTIKIGIGYGDEIAFFHLRRISVSEENAFMAKFAETKDLAPAEKTKAEIEICIDAIAAWSVLPPTKKADNDADVPFFESDTDVSVANNVRRYFAETEDDAERLANQLVLAYQTRLQPTVVFR